MITITIILLLLFYVYYLFLNIKELLTVDSNLQINIYDKATDTLPGGYNVGDLFNMPHFTHGWPRILHKPYTNVVKQFPNSIVYYYESLQESDDEPVPILNKLEKAVDLYIENNNATVSNIINNIDNNALYVHLRSGDKGIVEDEFIECINKLSNSYNKIIILTGVHADTRFLDSATSKNNLIESLKKLTNNKVELNLDIADNHLVIIHKCKNLLLHKGGFSVLASIIFTGNNLYYTNLYNGQNVGELDNYIKEKNINFILI